MFGKLCVILGVNLYAIAFTTKHLNDSKTGKKLPDVGMLRVFGTKLGILVSKDEANCPTLPVGHSNVL